MNNNEMSTLTVTTQDFSLDTSSIGMVREVHPYMEMGVRYEPTQTRFRLRLFKYLHGNGDSHYCAYVYYDTPEQEAILQECDWHGGVTFGDEHMIGCDYAHFGDEGTTIQQVFSDTLDVCREAIGKGWR